MAEAVTWPFVVSAAAAFALVRGREGLRLPRLATAGLATSVPIALFAAMPRTKSRAAIVWSAQMWAYKVLFELPYDEPEWLRRRVRVDYVVRSDTCLGMGRPLPQRLQAALRRPPALTPLDYALSLFYTTWEVEPHLALAWILWRHEDRFPSAALRLGAVFDATLIGYWLLPTAPPWWASEATGRMNGTVRRVVIEVKRALRGEPRPVSDHKQGANPWAAMPSDHFASALMTAMLVSELNSAAGVGAYAYALTLAFALVYLGEHYVTDMVAGGALALTVRWAASGISRRRWPSYNKQKRSDR
jgi:membrane-associated phospholipid phosphatase